MELSLDFMDLLLWAQQPFPRPGQPPPGAAAGILGLIICWIIGMILLLIVSVIMVISWWKIFTKAGEPGWAAIVPIYNFMIMGKISGRGEMFGLLAGLTMPCLVGVVLMAMLLIDLAKQFGKEPGFAIGMLLLPIVFVPMLGFGSARYVGGRRRPKRRAYDDEDDDDDEDDRPRRPASRRRDDDDDDDDRPPPPRKPAPRRRDDDDDDDDRPPPRRDQVRRPQR